MRALALAGFEGDLSAAARLMEDTFLSDGWEVYSDVVDALVTLGGSGYRMGVVSNWPATLEATLEREIFRIAAGRLGSDPRRALVVGDSVELDVVGA